MYAGDGAEVDDAKQKIVDITATNVRHFYSRTHIRKPKNLHDELDSRNTTCTERAIVVHAIMSEYFLGVVYLKEGDFVF